MTDRLANTPLRVRRQLQADAAGTGGLSSLPDSVARWLPFELTFTDAKNDNTGKSVKLYMLPPAGVVHAVKIKHSQRFRGGPGGLATCTVSVGIAGNLTKYAGAFDIFQSPGDAIMQISSIVGSENHAVETKLLARFEADVNLDDLSSGIVGIWLMCSITEDP